MNIRYINLDAYGAQSLLIDVYKFNFNTRFISNYLSKEIRRLKITGDGTYNMISVRLSDTQSEVELSYGGDRKDVLAIKLHMSEKEQHAYNAMTDLNERYELYLNLLEKGYILASQIKKVPLNVLLELHDKFRSNNYKNEWVWKKKTLPDYGICMVFKCYFTTFDFSLELNVFNKDQNILLTKGTVLQTGPDELFYDKEFCKLEIRENMLIIKDFLDRDNYMFNIAELARGIYNIKHLQKPSQINHVDLIKRIK